MEVLSETAAIASLIEMLSGPLVAVQHLRDARDAPVAIAELQNEIKGFRATILACNNMQAGDQAFLSSTLGKATNLMDEILCEIEAFLEKYDDTRWRPIKSTNISKWTSKDKEKTRELKQRLADYTSNLGMLVTLDLQSKIARFDSELVQDDYMNRANEKEILIAVMGETGSGKSQFIQRVTDAHITLGDSLRSEASHHVEHYSVTIGDRIVTLIDTPGFGDTTRTDVEVLEEIIDWLSETYKSKKLLTGIVYVHPITATRMRGSSVRSLEVFSQLVGIDSFHNILLVTTMWDLLSDQAVGLSREEELQERFWRSLIEKGSVTARSYGDRDSALAILKRVIYDQQTKGNAGTALKVQKEMVDEHKPLRETSAFKSLAQRLDPKEHKHQEQLRQVRLEYEKVISKMQREIDKLKEATTETSADAAKAPPLDLTGGHTTQKHIFVRFSAEELFEIESPPPYTALQDSVPDNSFRYLHEALMYSLEVLIDLGAMIGWSVNKFKRPSLRPGFCRIEFTCGCGDLLFADHPLSKDGSMHRLAAHLGGHIISERPLQGNQDDRTTMGRGSGTTSIAPGNTPTDMYGSRDRQSGQERMDPPPDTPSQIAINKRTESPNIPETHVLWLEMCIRSGPDVHVLQEIDVAGRQTDRTVFHRLGQRYWDSRKLNQIFGHFSLTYPDGGLFIKFQKIELASNAGEPPIASITHCPSIPSVEQRRQYKYVFHQKGSDDTLPMNQRLFNHFFQKPHKAGDEDFWVARFPKLQDASLFYDKNKLAVGWGIEIVEKGNWELFLGVNLAALMISGAVAGISCWALKDNQTGISIGAWLSAVQTVTLSLLFLRWTNAC